MQELASAIYEGDVFHERLTPVKHTFKYKVFMVYLDLSEKDRVFSLSRWWGESRFSPARFKRGDFHGDKSQPLTESVKNLVEQKLGFKPSGSVRMLANFRYFGFQMNPLVVYYCFDLANRLEAIVAEVNNTPWNEKHPYVLDCRHQTDENTHKFDKVFTVSPFNPINMTYHWLSDVPHEKLKITIKNTQDNQLIFHAGLSLKRVEINSSVLSRYLISYPLLTVKVIGAIYWQALKLYIKGVPFLGKDHKTSASNN